MNMMDFGDSVNMMDFGVSQRLAVLDESRRELLLDESRRNRSCASLDGLDELKEEMEFHNYNEGGGESLVGRVMDRFDRKEIWMIMWILMDS